jgi:threonine/homoserine/homoserine lactone efflux protein
VENFLQPLLAGLICGFVVSIPVGPVNLTVINQALRRGFRSAFLVGLGAICAEVIYASLMLAGHSSLVLSRPSVAYGMRVVAVAVIAAVGIRNLLLKPEKIEAGAATVERVDARWHHPRSFLLGFILTISNLVLVLMWATLAAALFTHDWVQPDLPGRALCATGVFFGGVVWFLLLAFFVSRAHRRVKNETLISLVRGCGVLFLGFAALLAYKLFV